ncbi:MAG: DNA N-6-adenine-methyltransferase [Microcoleus sp.]
MAGAVNNAAATHHEHPTPRSVIKAAHAVMSKIDLDPASSKEFNEVVGAAKFFTKEEDGFNKDWTTCQTVFLNPPGSQSLPGQPKPPSCHQWLDKLVNSLDRFDDFSHLAQAIYIGYNGSETLSRRPWHCRSALAALWTSVEGTATGEEGFIKSSGRMRFTGDRPYFPSIVLYFGWNSEGFREHFAKFGTFLEVC